MRHPAHRTPLSDVYPQSPDHSPKERPSARPDNEQTPFIVRLTHSRRLTEEYLASCDFSVAELSPDRKHAWQFPTRARALAGARLALGVRLRDFQIQVLPVGEGPR
jgi:hypothetical protein